jgi:hypothetical protein
MTEHDIIANFEVKASTIADDQAAAAADMSAQAMRIMDMITDRMAAAVGGGVVDAETKAAATGVYLMVLTMLQGLAEAKVLQLNVVMD